MTAGPPHRIRCWQEGGAGRRGWSFSSVEHVEVPHSFSLHMPSMTVPRGMHRGHRPRHSPALQVFRQGQAHALHTVMMMLLA